MRKKIITSLFRIAFKIVGLLPVNKNLVIFESFLGKQYSDNPRAIYEYMKKHHSEYTLLWSVDKRYNQIFVQNNIPFVKRFSISWLFKMARARYWVSNSRLPLWIPKPAHTAYLQTWHGTPLKKLANDMDEVLMPGTNTEKYKKNFLKEASNWDYLVSPNAYSSEIFKRAFQFDRKMIESGYPRNDVLFHPHKEKITEEIKEKLNLPKGKRIILYAPTWRDNEYYSKGKYKFNLALDLDKMHKELSEDFIILFRMHYLVSDQLNLDAYQDFAYDCSHHNDISELYLIADILMTDYSSVFFDYANLRRPMIFFVYDIESYRDQLRGFYFDFEKEAPGPLLKTTDEIILELKNIINETSIHNYEEFYQKFCYLEEGQSTKRVVETVFLK